MNGRTDFPASTLAVGHSPLSTVATRPRATDPTAGDQFRAALGRGASTVLSGLEATVPFVPGGVSTPLAVRAGASATTPATAATSDGSGASAAALAGDSGSQAMELLALQQRIGDEQQRFTTISSVMKARHETAKTVIGNVR